MTNETNKRLRSLSAAMTAVILALTVSGCAAAERERVSDTTICEKASVQKNDDGTATVQADWRRNPHGPEVASLRLQYTDGTGEYDLDPPGSIAATLEPVTVPVPQNAIRLLIDLVNRDGSIAPCPSQEL